MNKRKSEKWKITTKSMINNADWEGTDSFTALSTPDESLTLKNAGSLSYATTLSRDKVKHFL